MLLIHKEQQVLSCQSGEEAAKQAHLGFKFLLALLNSSFANSMECGLAYMVSFSYLKGLLRSGAQRFILLQH